jgi:chemotaxis protein histidine kinase CheA
VSMAELKPNFEVRRLRDSFVDKKQEQEQGKQDEQQQQQSQGKLPEQEQKEKEQEQKKQQKLEEEKEQQLLNVMGRSQLQHLEKEKIEKQQEAEKASGQQDKEEQLLKKEKRQLEEENQILVHQQLLEKGKQRIEVDEELQKLEIVKKQLIEQLEYEEEVIKGEDEEQYVEQLGQQLEQNLRQQLTETEMPVQQLEFENTGTGTDTNIQNLRSRLPVEDGNSVTELTDAWALPPMVSSAGKEGHNTGTGGKDCGSNNTSTNMGGTMVMANAGSVNHSHTTMMHIPFVTRLGMRRERQLQLPAELEQIRRQLQHTDQPPAVEDNHSNHNSLIVDSRQTCDLSIVGKKDSSWGNCNNSLGNISNKLGESDNSLGSCSNSWDNSLNNIRDNFNNSNHLLGSIRDSLGNLNTPMLAINDNSVSVSIGSIPTNTDSSLVQTERRSGIDVRNWKVRDRLIFIQSKLEFWERCAAVPHNPVPGRRGLTRHHLKRDIGFVWRVLAYCREKGTASYQARIEKFSYFS